MNKKFTKLIAALALLVFMTPSLVGWGQTSNYVITFGTGSGDGTSASTSTACSTIVSAGSDYLSGNLVTATKVYYNGDNGLKLGASSAAGVLKMNLSTSGQVTPTSIVVNAKLYNSSKAATLKVNGSATQNVTSDFSDLTFNITSTITYLQLESSKYIWVSSITVNYSSGGGNTPSMSVSTNSIDFGSNNTINPSEPYTETFDVTFANLTESLAITGFTGVTVSPATISSNATSPQTVTVSYNPTVAGSISGNISVNSSEVTEALVAVTGSAYDPANVDTYERYTGTIVEGDYVIYNTSGAMKSEISSSRFANQSVTISGTTITNPDATAVWHIAPDGAYWTIYNASVNKYAAGTTTKNQGALVNDATDNHAKWTITYQYSNFTIENYGRSQDTNDPNNKFLRQNSTSGWATYGSGTGSVPQLYKKVITNQVAKPSFSVAEGTYYESQSITLSCATDGATIYYTTDGSTPSASNGTAYSTAISVSTTTTIKAIAVKSGMADSDIATATYTIEQPYNTIPALFAAATAVEQDVRVTFNNWVVSGVSTNGKNVYVTDNTGNGFIIYFTSDMSGTFSAGKILSGTAVACKLKLYNGAAELINLDASDLTITDGGTVSIVNIAMASLSGVKTGALVHYDNLTCNLNNNKYNLSDGTTTLQAYNTLYAFNEFENGKTYNVTGVYVQFNNTKQIAPRSTNDIVEVIEEYTLTVTASANVEIFTFVGNTTNPGVEGSTTLQVNNGTEVGLSVSATEGYLLTLVVDGIDVTSQLDESGYYTFTMPTHNVTISATAVEYVAPTSSDYVRITSLDQLTDGSKVIIASRHNSTATSYYAMHSVFSFPGKPTGVQFTSIISNSDEMLPSTIADDEDNYYWTVNVINDNEYMFTNSENQIIACLSGETDFYQSTSYDYEWTIQRSTASSQSNQAMVPGYTGFVITNRDVTNRAFAFNGEKFGDYNTTNMNTSGYNFFLDFFVQSSEPTQTFTFEPDKWYLISPPTNNDGVYDLGDLITDQSYALYRFDQDGDEDGKEWINYKNTNSNYGGFSLEAGQGYLYANDNGCTLTYCCEISTGFCIIPLINHTVNANSKFHGLNLIGNPFGVDAYIDTDVFYVMAYNDENPAGEVIAATPGSAIAPMQGVFVYATDEYEDAFLTTTAPSKSGYQIALNVTKNRGSVIDRAIVHMGEGRQLPKFQIFEGSTRVYIPQNGKDYAVVSSEGQGELPVNFRAAENGTYTLSMDAESMDMNYLHLIDNMTGIDVDLLRTPSYTFEANTTDYESRFKLVFAGASATTEEENFAFFSNGNLIVNNEGNATLQVIDITGRILSSETLNGSASINVNQPTGVYMLRLINGDNVKVQKVVIK